MAPAQSRRQSRKRRRPRGAAIPGEPGTGIADKITPERIQAEIARQRAARQADKEARAQERRAGRGAKGQGSLATTLTGKTYGERPANPFGGVPVAEIAILAGGAGAVIGLVSSAAPALIVGVVVCTLGVLEFSVREHFSGYRSHTVMLAGVPAVGAGVVLIALDSASLTRELLLPVVLVVFAALFALLRRRFRSARQARVARPPGP
jgi:Flp pilus assembly protein TadB